MSVMSFCSIGDQEHYQVTIYIANLLFDRLAMSDNKRTSNNATLGVQQLYSLYIGYKSSIVTLKFSFW